MSSYLDRLTDRDLATLAAATGGSADQLKTAFRERPWSILETLGSDDVFDSVMDRQEHPGELVSPFLLFSVLVHRAASELRSQAFVNEWAGSRQRLPVFDIDSVHEYLADPGRVWFLTQLLDAFVHPAPLPVPVDDRFDLVSIAAWLDVVEDAHRPVLFRRLADLALFLSGVYPDHTGGRQIEPTQAVMLGETVGLDSESVLGLCDSLGLENLDAYETLGSRWYDVVLETERSPVIADVSYRFRAARRVLNHVADRFLHGIEPGWRFAA